MRLIDADALMECKFKNDIGYNAFCNLVKRQETVDAVPVVRCADCKHWGETDHGCHTLLGKCGYTGQCTPSFNFCCFGERREGTE